MLHAKSITRPIPCLGIAIINDMNCKINAQITNCCVIRPLDMVIYSYKACLHNPPLPTLML